jgi:hypothetical protein
MKIELTIAETNTILACLGRAPYEAVFALIENIRKQATDQSSQSSSSELGSDK